MERAVDEVIAACAIVQLAPTSNSLTMGVYPPAVEEASRALQKLRALSLP